MAYRWKSLLKRGTMTLGTKFQAEMVAYKKVGQSSNFDKVQFRAGLSHTKLRHCFHFTDPLVDD